MTSSPTKSNDHSEAEDEGASSNEENTPGNEAADFQENEEEEEEEEEEQQEQEHQEEEEDEEEKVEKADEGDTADSDNETTKKEEEDKDDEDGGDDANHKNTEDDDDDEDEDGKDQDKEDSAAPANSAPAPPEEPVPIWEPEEADVLSGRGASVNAHGGNKKFRALCFARKAEFDAGNHAAKRRIATEIVNTTLQEPNARFLKKKVDRGPWFEMTKKQAILKACQVMRDYKRPDRLAIREMMAQSGQARKRSRQQESTPMLDLPTPTGPLEPIIENPYGVHDHDILCGRGAFVNGHIGNQRLRKLAIERKTQFDSGNYTEKRTLATEIVQIIKSLDPPGRFLKQLSKAEKTEEEDQEEHNGGAAVIVDEFYFEKTWKELPDEKAIHKACQVMRDIDRPDRKDREIRRQKKKQKLIEKAAVMKEAASSIGQHEPHPHLISPSAAATAAIHAAEAACADYSAAKKDGMTVLAETTAEKAAVEEAVAATEEALDKALDAAENSRTKDDAMALASV